MIKLSTEPILLLTKEEEAHIIRAAIGHGFYALVGWQERQDDIDISIIHQVNRLTKQVEKLTTKVDQLELHLSKMVGIEWEKSAL